ncbi:phage portal protein family protein [Chroococcidiopsis sp.]|uniref:phage portal protein family protein n=1 Tax=Chroococcidiopsis sp. TaxID=3088168 RepID=UPI003F2C8FF1
MVATNGNKKIASDQIGEISSVARDYPAGLASYSRYFLNREDGRIIARGKGQKLSDIYRDTEKDAQIRQGLAQRYGAALARETVVEPASQSRLDKKVADEVRNQIKNLNRRKPQLLKSKNAVYSFGDFDFFTRGMLDAIYMDYAVAEIDWALEGDRVVARQIWNRDQSRFIFDIADGGYELRLLTFESMFEGIVLPPRKFLVHSVGSPDGNPYGGGLAETLFWWVWFKRQELRFWLVFSDKYGSPTLKAQYETEAQKNKLLEIMRNVSQQAGVALPKGATLELLSAATSHTSTYKELCDYCDEQITSVILLQNLTTNVSGGSYAASETHFEVLSELVDSDTSALTSGPFNDLASWICEFNFGIDATPPLIYKPRVRVADEARARRDAVLVGLVQKPMSNQYLSTHYDISFKSDEEIAAEEKAKAALAPPETPPGQNEDTPFVFSEGIDPIQMIDKLASNGASIAEVETMVDLLINSVGNKSL